tara:strand:+ start:258 stop:557 length:300 start_codon:yes stop_codon:yes gene_type:complete
MHGLEVYAANGELLIDVSSRMTRSVASGTTSSIADGGSVSVTVPNMTNSAYWQVFVAANSPPQNINARFQDCTRYSGYFTITNNMGTASTFDYVVVRSG